MATYQVNPTLARRRTRQTGDISRRQHHIPAALIGGFGQPAGSGRRRDATVAVRWRNGSRGVQVVAASHIGWRSNEYRLQEPGHGDPDFLDRAWTALENDLPPTVARLASRSPVPADYGTIIAYIAGAGVRHPTFGEHARAERSARGEKAPEGDAIQWERVSTLRGSFDILEEWHFRVLHRPAEAPPFLISDFGWCKFQVGGRGPTAHVFPLNSDCAILAYPPSPQLAPTHASGINAHFTLVPSVMDLINSTAWAAPETSWVAIHPIYWDYLNRLEQLQGIQWPWLGPYRGRRGDLFD